MSEQRPAARPRVVEPVALGPPGMGPMWAKRTRIMKGSPMTPWSTIFFALRLPRWNRCEKPTIKTVPLLRTAALTRAISRMVRAAGFSSRTWAPAFRAATACSAWKRLGLATESTSDSPPRASPGNRHRCVRHQTAGHLLAAQRLGVAGGRQRHAGMVGVPGHVQGLGNGTASDNACIEFSGHVDSSFSNRRAARTRAIRGCPGAAKV